VKIRRFVAKDMRTALAQIKEELGADAVIMSNKKIAEGVELMAAVDNNQPAPTATVPEETQQAGAATAQAISQANRDLQSDQVTLGSDVLQNNAHKNATAQKIDAVQTSVQSQNVAPSQSNAPVDSLAALLNRKIQQTELDNVTTPQAYSTEPEKSVANDIEQQFKNFTDRLQQTNPNQTINAQNDVSSEFDDSGFDQTPATSNFQQSSSTNVVGSAEFEKMQKEMASIRQLLEHQMSGLMWQDMAQKDPSRAVLVDRLTNMGITDSLADQIAGYIPSQMNEEDAWQQAMKVMAQQINTTNNDIIHRGGVVALVGPTGVGKTTTIAKLAARFAQTYGADQVAMISTDSFRIAGFEQLSTYGRIIGCQVKLAKDAESLDALLQQYAKKKLILIDTAGMGQRDMRLAEHLTTLIANARVRIRNYLVLSANTQQRVMQENVERFKKVPLAGCIYTKLDESLSVGEVISTSIQNGLPIGYLTDGQRVPEDIKVANAEKLVTLAGKMADKLLTNNQHSWRPKPMSSAAGF